MRNITGMKAPAQRLLICSVVLAISVAIVIFGSAAAPQKLSSVPPTTAQEKLPDKEFTHAPEKPHDPTAFFFNFDQLDHYYRVPGEFTHRLTGDQYGFESLSFIITETHPGGGPGLHVHDTGSSQIAQAPAQHGKQAQELRRLEDEWVSSYLRGDKTIFDRIVADDFTGTDESGKLRNKAQERELIQAPPSSINASLTNEDVQLRIYGGTAIVTGRIVSRAQLGGQGEISFQSRFTDTLLKRQGRWQVVARHYSRLPPEHKAVNLDAKVFEAYIGQYEIAPNFVFAVTKEGDKLMSQATGQPKYELLPESETAFFIKDIPALFIFMRGEKGDVNQLITVQDGRLVSAKRFK